MASPPAGFAAAARRALAVGYRAVKLAPFDGVIAEDAATTPIDDRIRAGLDRVFAVRDAIGAPPALMLSVTGTVAGVMFWPEIVMVPR